jgi:hypothetical protein
LLVYDLFISSCSTDIAFFIIYVLLRLSLPLSSARLKGAVDIKGAENFFWTERHTGGDKGRAFGDEGARRRASGVLIASIIVVSF